MIQAWTKEYWDEKRLEFIKQENILKLKIKLIDWFIYNKVQRQSTDFPYITFDTEQKEHTWHSCK